MQCNSRLVQKAGQQSSTGGRTRKGQIQRDVRGRSSEDGEDFISGIFPSETTSGREMWPSVGPGMSVVLFARILRDGEKLRCALGVLRSEMPTGNAWKKGKAKDGKVKWRANPTGHKYRMRHSEHAIRRNCVRAFLSFLFSAVLPAILFVFLALSTRPLCY
jgi:hypothetical protein